MAKKKPAPKTKQAGLGKKPPAPPPAPPINPEDQPLTDDEERYVQEYLVDRKRATAYRRANPGCERVASWNLAVRMHQRPHVRAAIRREIQDQGSRLRVEADLALKEMCYIGFSDIMEVFDPQTNLLRHPRHIPYELRKAISSIKVSRERHSTTQRGRTTTRIVDTVVEYKLWNKVDALDKLASHLGLKTSIPPIEALLQALPQPLQGQVRLAITQMMSSNKTPAILTPANKQETK